MPSRVAAVGYKRRKKRWNPPQTAAAAATAVESNPNTGSFCCCWDLLPAVLAPADTIDNDYAIIKRRLRGGSANIRGSSGTATANANATANATATTTSNEKNSANGRQNDILPEFERKSTSSSSSIPTKDLVSG